jgi:hypothetical protein
MVTLSVTRAGGPQPEPRAAGPGARTLRGRDWPERVAGPRPGSWTEALHLPARPLHGPNAETPYESSTRTAPLGSVSMARGSPLPN